MENNAPSGRAAAWPVIGHDGAVGLLAAALAGDRVGHAYLIAGPPQVGKTTLALALAQALNCLRPDPPCGRCASCGKIQRRAHPDVRVITGEGAAGGIKIDQIRAVQHEAMLAPYEGRRRVFVIRQAEQATLEAANSLLKTLEEPPPSVVLILTAVDAESLPRTVVSRCQRLDLRPVPLPTIESALRERQVAPETAQVLARLSGGRLGWALAAAADPGVLRQRQQGLDRLMEALAAGRVERLELAQALSRDQAGARQLVEQWTGWWRDLLLIQKQVGTGVINADRDAELRAVERQVSQSQVAATIGALKAAAAQLEANVNPRLALEGLILALPRLRTVP